MEGTKFWGDLGVKRRLHLLAGLIYNATKMVQTASILITPSGLT